MITAEQEREKYRRMWSVPAYRNYSPGAGLATEFRARLAKAGDTVIDLGCGTGRAADMLRQKGIEVTGFDIAENALDGNISIPFIHGCLWNMPADFPRFDWFFCADVMEHIPEEHIDAVLDNAARIAGRGGMFQIAHFEDGFGNMIGERLHLTVRPAEWWQPKIRARWPRATWDDSGNRSLIFVEHAEVNNHA